MRGRAVLAALAAFTVLAGVGIVLVIKQIGDGFTLPRVSRSCVTEADGQVELSPEQMANAATIAAIGVQRGLPERAVIVALATAFQESQLRNLAGGDRDSVGLFQQRPSQGWGTPEQIQDTRYAATQFYAALEQVRGWEKMRVTDAAQTVQRSAFPEAYEKWSEDSTVLTRALLGQFTGAVACTVSREPALRGDAATEALLRGLKLDWGVSRDAASPATTGLTLTAQDERQGWRYAHWLVSHANDHGVQRVRFDDLEWTAADGRWKSAEGEVTPGSVVAEVSADA